jgi:hypothetical protein
LTVAGATNGTRLQQRKHVLTNSDVCRRRLLTHRQKESNQTISGNVHKATDENRTPAARHTQNMQHRIFQIYQRRLHPSRKPQRPDGSRPALFTLRKHHSTSGTKRQAKPPVDVFVAAERGDVSSHACGPKLGQVLKKEQLEALCCRLAAACTTRDIQHPSWG